jgi:hypothetical protein
MQNVGSKRVKLLRTASKRKMAIKSPKNVHNKEKRRIFDRKKKIQLLCVR